MVLRVESTLDEELERLKLEAWFALIVELTSASAVSMLLEDDESC